MRYNTKIWMFCVTCVYLHNVNKSFKNAIVKNVSNFSLPHLHFMSTYMYRRHLSIGMSLRVFKRKSNKYSMQFKSKFVVEVLVVKKTQTSVNDAMIIICPMISWRLICTISVYCKVVNFRVRLKFAYFASKYKSPSKS